MKSIFKRNAIALLVAPALAALPAALQAAGDKQAQEEKSWVEKSKQTYDERGPAPSDKAAAGSNMTDPVTKQAFSALDQNNDGTLSMMEAASDPDAKQQFNTLDKNNDYRLSRSEYEALEKVSKESVGASAAAGASASAQQGQQQQARNQQGQKQQGQKQSLRNWDVSKLYRNTWSANEMIDTDVRGANGEEIGEVKDIIVDRNGNISKVIVEVGGFLEMGDQHIGVPFKDVKIGRNMESVQVPLREVESGTYSLYGRVPQGEDVAQARTSWRVNELIGDYASLADVPRYGMVTDALFDTKGKLQAVVINRTAGAWGNAGWYGYPYAGYRPGYNYGFPYRSTDVGDRGRFDYVLFAEESEWAGERSAQRQQQAREGQRQQQRGSAAGGATGAQQEQQNPQNQTGSPQSSSQPQAGQQSAAAGAGQSQDSFNVIMHVQRQLNANGFDAGAVNGVMNSTTQRALRNFQEEKGLEVTGQVNQETLSALDLPSKK